MNGRPAPEVYVTYNPWRGMVEIEEYLLRISDQNEQDIQRWIDQGMALSDANFAQVYLDPTRPSDVSDHLAYAVALYGSKAAGLVPPALAKADATARHGVPNGELIKRALYCLGPEDYAWEGGCILDDRVVGAGHGLSGAQNCELVSKSLLYMTTSVTTAQTRRLAERREEGGQGWLNRRGLPPEKYLLDPTRNSRWRRVNP